MHNNSRILTLQSPHWWMRRLQSTLLLCMALLAPVATAQHIPQMLGWDIPMQRLDDRSGTLTPEAVMADGQPDAHWHTMDHALNAGYLGQVVWLRFTVPQAASKNEASWLLGEPTYLDSVVLYQRDEAAGVWVAQRSGDHIHAHEKPRYGSICFVWSLESRPCSALRPPAPCSSRANFFQAPKHWAPG